MLIIISWEPTKEIIKIKKKGKEKETVGNINCTLENINLT